MRPETSTHAVTPDVGARLVVEGLCVDTADRRAAVVEDASFALHAGEVLGLIGESGSGKTTLALALMAYARSGLRISGGRVVIDEASVLELPAAMQRSLRGNRIAYVPQDPGTALNPALRIRTQLEEVYAAHGVVSQARIMETLEEVNLQPALVLPRYPHQLSGGQQQRVAIAMAFALNPDVIVLDEPTTGLDVTTQRRVLDTIRRMCSSHGVAGIFVSHDIAVVGEIVDHIGVLYAGQMVEYGPIHEILAQPTHPYTRALIGAMPAADRADRVVGLDGQPPRPGARPDGCYFAARCRYAEDICRTGRIALRPVAHSPVIARCVRISELPPRQQELRSIPVGRSTGQDVVLDIEKLRAGYGTTQVLAEVDLSVHEGECAALVGESGSGKTTLARCIVGLHPRHEGTIRLLGQPLARRTRDRERQQLQDVQYIFQSPYSSLNPRKRVGQIVEEPLRHLFSLDKPERHRQVIRALEDAALDASFVDLYPSELSGGERQRVAIARALVANPAVLVCDEITSALDVSVQAAVVETLMRLQRDRQLSILFITHNLGLVRSLAQTVVVLQHGRIVEFGDTQRVLDRPIAEYTQNLMRDLPRLGSMAGTSSASIHSGPTGRRGS